MYEHYFPLFICKSHADPNVVVTSTRLHMCCTLRGWRPSESHVANLWCTTRTIWSAPSHCWRYAQLHWPLIFNLYTISMFNLLYLHILFVFICICTLFLWHV